ncbi:uncharacterized protein STEHIDRAFT_161435 [Stereum hirsutum FP-91666 SS1]|uniref:uncharacterized protein n=1 Tax=Stereum hirsutum (strain FP-91666) TaxID=721885 RepID=UPI00044493AC|nr:uncharacterized protein STEHIDRAFT_161435 [Stereum hirsutum FP-91666 SS1]EIM82086.1 hypothetical protein STEHIDRAFT_161435 [Stereum hirsutum FP-91666 SS1]
MAVSIEDAALLSLSVEMLIYGSLLTLEVFVINTLLDKRKNGGKHVGVALLPVAVLMLALATGHFVVDVVKAINTFSVLKYHGHDAASKYYQSLSDPLFLAKNSIYLIQTSLGDGILLWRCYIVCGKNWRAIIVPVLSIPPTMIGGTISIIQCSLVKNQNPNDVPLNPAIILSYVCTLITTIYCTCKFTSSLFFLSRNHPLIRHLTTAAISWNVYRSSRISQSNPIAGSLASRVIFAVVQSGALYTFGILAFLVTYLAGTLLQCVPLDSVTPLVGVTFCLIMMQLRAPRNDQYVVNSDGPVKTIPRTTTRISFAPPSRGTFMTSTITSRVAPVISEDNDGVVRDGDEVYTLEIPKQGDVYRASSDTAWSRETLSRVATSSVGKEAASVNAEKIEGESLAVRDGREEGIVAYELGDLA